MASRTVDLTGIDLLGILNALNEVAHGLPDVDVDTALRDQRAAIESLQRRGRVFDLADPIETKDFDWCLDDEELRLAVACLEMASQALSENDFHSRLGVSKAEADATRVRLLQAYRFDAEESC